MASKLISGCLIIIGNEILSGRTQDTNLAHLAKALNELGVRMVEARVIPDVVQTIVDTVNECRANFDYVFTTGGIGPTHDDITADCIALAFDTELEMHPDIVEIIQRREAPPEVMESRLRMARCPFFALPSFLTRDVTTTAVVYRVLACRCVCDISN